MLTVKYKSTVSLTPFLSRTPVVPRLAGSLAAGGIAEPPPRLGPHEEHPAVRTETAHHLVGSGREGDGVGRQLGQQPRGAGGQRVADGKWVSAGGPLQLQRRMCLSSAIVERGDRLVARMLPVGERREHPVD